MVRRGKKTEKKVEKVCGGNSKMLGPLNKM